MTKKTKNTIIVSAVFGGIILSGAITAIVLKTTGAFDNNGIVMRNVSKEHANQKVIGYFVGKDGKEYVLNSVVNQEGRVTFVIPKNLDNLSLLRIERSEDNGLVYDSVLEKLRTLKLDPINVGKYKNRNLIGIIKYDDKSNYKVLAKANDAGVIEFNLGNIPPERFHKEKYKVVQIIDENTGQIVPFGDQADKTEEIIVDERIPFKVSLTSSLDKIMTLNLDLAHIKKDVKAIFVGTNNKEFISEFNAGPDAKIIITNSMLPLGDDWYLKEVVEDKGNSNIPSISLVNLNNASKVQRTFYNSLGFLANGDLAIGVNVGKHYINKEVVGSFTKDGDQNPIQIKSKVNKDGSVFFNLRDENQKPLDNYVLTNVLANNKTIFSPKDLNETQRQVILSPNSALNIKTDSKTNHILLHAQLPKGIQDYELVAVFKDLQGYRHQIVSKTDENGEAIFDTTNKLFAYNTYTLEEIFVKNSNPKALVINLDDVNKERRTIKKEFLLGSSKTNSKIQSVINNNSNNVVLLTKININPIKQELFKDPEKYITIVYKSTNNNDQPVYGIATPLLLKDYLQKEELEFTSNNLATNRKWKVHEIIYGSKNDVEHYEGKRIDFNHNTQIEQMLNPDTDTTINNIKVLQQTNELVKVEFSIQSKDNPVLQENKTYDAIVTLTNNNSYDAKITHNHEYDESKKRFLIQFSIPVNENEENFKVKTIGLKLKPEHLVQNVNNEPNNLIYREKDNQANPINIQIKRYKEGIEKIVATPIENKEREWNIQIKLKDLAQYQNKKIKAAFVNQDGLYIYTKSQDVNQLVNGENQFILNIDSDPRNKQNLVGNSKYSFAGIQIANNVDHFDASDDKQITLKSKTQITFSVPKDNDTFKTNAEIFYDYFDKSKNLNMVKLSIDDKNNILNKNTKMLIIGKIGNRGNKISVISEKDIQIQGEGRFKTILFETEIGINNKFEIQQITINPNSRETENIYLKEYRLIDQNSSIILETKVKLDLVGWKKETNEIEFKISSLHPKVIANRPFYFTIKGKKTSNPDKELIFEDYFFIPPNLETNVYTGSFVLDLNVDLNNPNSNGKYVNWQSTDKWLEHLYMSKKLRTNDIIDKPIQIEKN